MSCQSSYIYICIVSLSKFTTRLGCVIYAFIALEQKIIIIIAIIIIDGAIVIIINVIIVFSVLTRKVKIIQS